MGKILITGCNGLVGSCLRDIALRRNLKVVGVDRVDPVTPIDHPNFEFRKLDLLVEQNIISLFEGEKYRGVFNCFGIKGSPLRAKNNPSDFLYPSFKINTEIINQCYLNDIWLVFVSSVGVYSPSEKFVEDDVWKTLPSESDWFPSWSKRMGELLLQAYEIQYQYKNWTIVRPANIFGECDDYSGNGTLISTMVKKVYESDGEIEAWGDGTPIRDFVYANDVAIALLKLYDDRIHDIVNFGSGIEVSIKNVVEEIIKVSGKDIKINWDPSKPNGDMRRLMDTTKQKMYGIMPQTGFSRAIENVYNYYSEYVKMEKDPIPLDELLHEGCYSGKLSNYLNENDIEDLKKMSAEIKEYSEEDRENRISCRYDYDDQNNKYDHNIPPSQVEVRDKLIEENKFHVWQKWMEFKHPNNLEFKKYAIKIVKQIYPQYADKIERIREAGDFALFEDGHFIDNHRDGENEGRICVIIIYLTDKEDHKNGGGELILTTNSKKKYSVDPHFGNFCILDFSKNNIEHSVNVVKNGFKRYTYINFININNIDDEITEN
jgi:GDP-L-fucose synthase